MPRGAREKSNTGIYHAILRGTNKQEIFHDDEDHKRFLDILKKSQQASKVKVYGWCLMGNHLHLLLAEGNEDLSITMKRIGVSYVGYYHNKYATTGHLFQDRFRSEKVESDNYLLTVIRYIHQNPVKAGIVKRVEDWKWSSCLQYYGKMSHPHGLLDKSLILENFSEHEGDAVINFKKYNENYNEDICLEDDNGRLSDEEAKEKITKILPKIRLTQIKNAPKNERDEAILKIKRIEGVTHRQIARILGISANLVFKA